MCISVFYGQLLGLWLAIVGLAFVRNNARFKKMLLDSLEKTEVMNFSGLIALGLGLVIVVSHNFWVMAWPVLVTLFGWILVLQGVLRLHDPSRFTRFMKKATIGKRFNYISWIWLLVGVYLIFMSFSAV